MFEQTSILNQEKERKALSFSWPASLAAQQPTICSKNMNNISITIASKKDLPAILKLQKEAYISEATIYNDFNIPPLMQSNEQIEEEFSDHIFLKAEVEGKIIGSVRASEKNGVCFVGKLIVDVSAQNKGLGKKLLETIESHFQDVDKYELFTGHKSVKNLHIYNKYGYTAYGERKINNYLTIITLHKNNN